MAKTKRKPRPTDFDDEDAVLRDMAKALDVDPDDLTIKASHLSSFGTGDFYEVSLGQKDYTVAADDDAAEALALAVVKQDIEQEPEIFNRSFIESHINIDRLRNDLYSDVQNMRYEDLKEEAEKRPEQFLKDNDLEWPTPTDAQVREGAATMTDEDLSPEALAARITEIRAMDPEDQWTEIGEEPEVPDSDIEDVATAEADAQLKDPMSYLEDIYGREDAVAQAIKIAGIDENAAAEDAVSTDGWQHFLARYDGNSYDTPGGLVYWRDN